MSLGFQSNVLGPPSLSLSFAMKVACYATVAVAAVWSLCHRSRHSDRPCADTEHAHRPTSSAGQEDQNGSVYFISGQLIVLAKASTISRRGHSPTTFPAT